MGLHSDIAYSDLHLDVHINIFRYLNPLDVLAVRKTCRTLSNATLQRTVWIDALEHSCFENTSYFPSFPTSSMSLHELEQATLGTHLWKKFIEKNASDEIPLPIRKEQRIRNDGVEFKSLFLVPGGRFLITMDSSSNIAFWDITFLGGDSVLRPLAFIESDIDSFTVHPSPNGRGIRILTRKLHQSSYQYTFKIYDINPLDPFPKVKNLGSINVLRDWDMEFTSVWGDKLLLVHGPVIKIWNFITDEWASWHTNRTPCQMFPKDDLIILIGIGDITIWDVPALDKDAQNRALTMYHSCNIEPIVVIKYPGGGNLPATICCQSICDWYTGSQQPLSFDIINNAALGEAHPRSLILSRYELDFAKTPERAVSLRQKGKHIIGPGDSEIQFFTPYRVCDDSILVPWVTSSDLRCGLGPFDSSGNTSFQPRTAILAKSRGIGWRQSSVCPVAGRLCCTSDDCQELRVIDYLTSTSVAVVQDISVTYCHLSESLTTSE